MDAGVNFRQDDTFRDSVGTISSEGKRKWIYPRKPHGRFYDKRALVSIVLLALLFSGPFMKWDGHPFLLFNILERKFILFGVPFWPQDFFLFVLAMLTFFVFIILFTSVFGRVWCGWACPQTIFMEMVFRKIEYWIEGDAQRQRQLADAQWDTDKVRKKLLKHGIFFLLSFLIANTFLAYLIGVDQLGLLVSDGPLSHAGSFFSLLGFTGVFYGVYARFREQACLVVCPYGRLQGVLLDRNSLVIAYDHKRGEPRGKLHRDRARTSGDCVDCHQCVDVCPTGIDIRNGTQLECVNCTACIDACDGVMEKVGFSKGLIRYASEENISSGKAFKVTGRIVGYSVLLVLLFSTLVTLLAMRSDVEATLLRTPGQMYQQPDSVHYSNLYNIQIANKTFRDVPVKLEFAENSVEGEIRYVGAPLERVAQDSLAEAVLFIVLPSEAIKGLKTPVTLKLMSEGKEVGRVKTNFMGPVSR
jgi:cytochrome c oxidase accessory protein FixG